MVSDRDAQSFINAYLFIYLIVVHSVIISTLFPRQVRAMHWKWPYDVLNISVTVRKG